MNTTEPLRDATNPAPVRQHIRTLMAADTGWRVVADLAGVPRSKVHRILYRNPTSIDTATAKAILSVAPNAPHPKRHADTKADATGTRRRIHAMHHDGYDIDHISGAVGERPQKVRAWLCSARIDANYVQAIEDLFARWSGVPAENNGIHPEVASAARALARRRRWAKAGAWDEETNPIDDPDVVPTPWYGIRRSADLFADSEELLAQRLPFDVVAARLEVKVNTLQKARERMRARARAAEHQVVAA